MNKIATAIIVIGLSVLLSTGTVSAASSKTHIVINNDTFWKLSLQYNVSLNSLLQANSAIDPLNMMVGQKVAIPGPALQTNTVQSMATTSKVIETSKAPSIVAPSGKAYPYSKQLNVKATAYTAAASENGKWGAVDYYGNKLKVGTIAVDPKMIPLGTKLYITGYNFNGLPVGGMIATATDMGGSIKGNRIDIFVPGSTQQALKFGIQDVKAYILDEA